MAAPAELGHLPPDHREAVEPRRAALDHQPPAPDRGAAQAAVAGFREAQIDEAVIGEIGVEDDVAEPALPAIIDRRHAGDVDRAAAHRPQFEHAAPLGDQSLAAAGKEGHRPGLGELADRLDLERAVLRRRAAATGAAEDHGGEKQGTEPAHRQSLLQPPVFRFQTRAAPSSARWQGGPPGLG